jgi:arginyl-tRNA synthetase
LVWKALTEGFAEALRRSGFGDPSHLARLELAVPRESAHGDWTTNLALLLAKGAGRPPRAVAEALAAAFPLDPRVFSGIEIAGPGFVNFRYAPEFLNGLPARILEEGPLDLGKRGGFGCFDHARGLRIQVEYVSANPTGPLNVVSARAAAVGAALVRLLGATGHDAAGEFYVNDAGRQVELLGESVAARSAEAAGFERPFPEDGYRGGYVRDIAGELPTPEARAALADGRLDWFRDRALEAMVASQRRDLSEYGAEFARWFHESELHRSGAVDATLAELEARGMVYRAAQPESGPGDRAREEGEEETGEATFLRTARFGDDVDRVVVRSNGVPTYLLPDIAYHRDKRARGFRHCIDLWGPDHHGYVARMKAALLALGLEPDFLEILIVQQVNLLAGGEPVKMSKRAGEFVTLRDLMDDIGADCAKFFFLMRTTNAHLDFDLDLARRQNDENPAYYVQYAHARIASILRFARDRGLEGAGPRAPGEPGLDAPEEIALLRRLAAFPEIVRGAAFAREPHRIPAWLVETAATFHRFYHACRVVSDDAPRSRARLRLAEATRLVIANGLALMGVGAPERMDRSGEEPS